MKRGHMILLDLETSSHYLFPDTNGSIWTILNQTISNVQRRWWPFSPPATDPGDGTELVLMIVGRIRPSGGDDDQLLADLPIHLLQRHFSQIETPNKMPPFEKPPVKWNGIWLGDALQNGCFCMLLCCAFSIMAAAWSDDWRFAIWSEWLVDVLV